MFRPITGAHLVLSRTHNPVRAAANGPQVLILCGQVEIHPPHAVHTKLGHDKAADRQGGLARARVPDSAAGRTNAQYPSNAGLCCRPCSRVSARCCWERTAAAASHMRGEKVAAAPLRGRDWTSSAAGGADPHPLAGQASTADAAGRGRVSAWPTASDRSVSAACATAARTGSNTRACAAVRHCK